MLPIDEMIRGAPAPAASGRGARVVIYPLRGVAATGDGRAMPFRRIEAETLAQSVVRQIEHLILRGIVRPGARLPSDRELAARQGVSRPSLREAVGELQARGLLATRVGAGIYVPDMLGSAFSDALIGLFAAHEEAVFDDIAVRRDLAGIAEARAASAGSATDLNVIDAVFARMEAAHCKRNPADEAEFDAEFHLAIIDGHTIAPARDGPHGGAGAP